MQSQPDFAAVGSRRTALFYLLASCAAPMIARAGDACAPACCHRDIWLIDTHCLGDCECDVRTARFLRLNECGQWVQESHDSFFQTHDVAKPVNVFLPGYMSRTQLVVEHGWSLQRGFEQYAHCHGADCPNVRLVFWDWPSEVERLRLINDARAKAIRADQEGFWVGQLVSRMPAEARVNLVGYSFGARIATSAANNLAGGYCGHCPFEPSPTTPHLTGVLVASAVDAEWLSYSQPHSLALQRFDKLLLLNNCHDRVLKRFRVLDRATRPEALGAVGLLLPYAASASHVEQWEVSHIVGRTHNWYRYVESPEIMSAITRYALFRH